MLILHVSDTHLGAIPSGLLFRARDIYEAFKETIDIALKERVNVYIHTGDFFNNPNPPPEAYVVAYRGLKKLKEKDIKVIVIAGQHDLPKRYALSPLSILKDVGVLDHVAIDNIASTEVDIGNTKTTFICIPYNLRNKIPSLSIPKESRSILMAHLLLKELGIPTSEADISLDLIPQGFKYIALGDYHVRTVLSHRDGSPAVYPGATEVHRVNEYDKKYVALVDLSRSEATFNFIELQSVRPWVILKCDDAPKCVNELLEKVKTIISGGKKKPLAYIAVEKIKSEFIAKYLDDLVSKNLIEHYMLTHKEHGEEDYEVAVEGFVEKLEYVDVEKILKELLGDENLALHILSLVENPSKQAGEELMRYLKSNLENLRNLELTMRTKLSQITIKSDTSSAELSASKNQGKQLKGLLP
ncbi:MAG: DNA repair exonuclease [Ignisphaera sp.]|uniref:DNA repair exonuclease n=1 Tax=Ignisphaera aggregans TaxID=334771 RepID=A0A7C4JIQ5_9CREN